MTTPFSFSACSVGVKNSSTTRLAWFTFGVSSGTLTAQQTHAAVVSSLGVTGGIKTRLGNTCTYAYLKVSTGAGFGDADIVYEGAINVAGSAFSEMAPANVALLVHKRTALGGRRGRGRLFLPWHLNEANVDGAGVLVSNEASSSQTAMNTWLADLNTRSIPMVLLHQKSDKSDTPLPTPVTSLVVDTMVSTQRRRLGR